MKRLLFLIMSVASCLPLAGGCGSQAPAPVVEEVPGYQALREQFSGLDMTPLQRRRIVLDPGHGGFFKGAVGPSGLTEAEVNLGVSLYLRGLLEWAGAEVFMTRTADYDFLTPADSTLTSDLAFRAFFADSLQPDVFLSLHHNSVASLDRTINETQTYYPLGDDGASLDLARAIHRHLVINLEISPAKILPGNFHVLRNATVPAVLGEPAMISHPVIEDRLSLAASQRLEAEAYFLGLLDYFSQGSPTWTAASGDTVEISADRPFKVLRWTFAREDSLHIPHSVPGPDPGSFELSLGGRQVPFHVTGSGNTVSWQPADPNLELPNVLELRGRNLAGRATPVHRTVLIPTPARRVQLSFMPESQSTAGGQVGLRWSVSGPSPLPPGRFQISGDPGSPPHFSFPEKGGLSGATLVPFTEGHPVKVKYAPEVGPESLLPCDVTTVPLPAPWQWRRLTGYDLNSPGSWSFRTAVPDSLPAVFADQTMPLIPYEPGRPVWVAARGWLPLVDPDPANPDTARTVDANERDWPTQPIVPGLLGKVIVLDPDGGGSDPDGTGPLGTRGTTLNLETALLAKGLLEGCGAVVHLTRQGETTLPDQDKVRLAGRVGADYFMTIGRSRQPDTFVVKYHPGSEMGKRWAYAFLNYASGLSFALPEELTVSEPSYAYLLRHTACPALEARFPSPDLPWQEIHASKRGWQRAEARAVLLSLVSLIEPKDRRPPVIDVGAVIRSLPGAPDPAEVDWAELDGNLLWSPVPRPYDPAEIPPLSAKAATTIDSAVDPGLPALLKRHTLEIHSGGVQQLWLLERSGAGFSARLMMHNR